MKTGLCSWDCWARFYNLVEDGHLVCRCGSSEIQVPGAVCLECQVRRPDKVFENERFIFAGKRRFSNELSTA